MADEKIVPAVIPPNSPTSVSNNATTNMSPTGKPLLPQWLVAAATGLVLLAGFVLTLPSMGVSLPGVVLAIASGIVTVGAAFGLASPGIRTHPK